MAEISTSRLKDILQRTVGPTPWYWKTFSGLISAPGQRFVWTHHGSEGPLGYLVTLKFHSALPPACTSLKCQPNCSLWRNWLFPPAIRRRAQTARPSHSTSSIQTPDWSRSCRRNGLRPVNIKWESNGSRARPVIPSLIAFLGSVLGPAASSWRKTDAAWNDGWKRQVRMFLRPHIAWVLKI